MPGSASCVLAECRDQVQSPTAVEGRWLGGLDSVHTCISPHLCRMYAPLCGRPTAPTHDVVTRPSSSHKLAGHLQQFCSVRLLSVASLQRIGTGSNCARQESRSSKHRLLNAWPVLLRQYHIALLCKKLTWQGLYSCSARQSSR